MTFISQVTILARGYSYMINVIVLARTVIASEAKQSRMHPRKQSGLLRRYAPRNDDKTTRVRILAAQFARDLLELRPSEKQRAQGKPGAGCTRSLVCNKKAHE
jgi:hypothetical protein